MRIEGLDNLTPEGSGGFSQVFRATEIRYDRTVAAKVLNFRLDDPSDRERFERECQAMAQLSDHPNIVPLYSTTYTDDGYPVIIMEFFTGGTLWTFARKGAATAQLLDAGVKLASALHTAHERGVTHRDVKPQNVLMSRFSEPGLTDFGISVFDRHRAQGRNRGITLAYASPEALDGSSSRQTDVYSLAATLYTVLADRRPYDLPGHKQSTSDLVRRILGEDPPSLQTFGFSAAVDHTIRRLGMARAAADRPATAAEFGEALRRLQVNEGYEQTPWLEAHEVTDTSLPTELGDESQAVIHQPLGAPTQVELQTQAAAPDRGRRVRAAVGGVAALLLVVAVAVLARGRADDAQNVIDDVTPAPIVTADDFYVAPAIEPTEVTIEADGEGGAVMRWQNPNTVPVTFEVQQVRGGRLVGPILSAPSTTIELDDVAPGDCFTVRSVGTAQQISLDVPEVCLVAQG